MAQQDRTQKIDGKFYPLQHHEWLQTAKALTHSELLVLYHLRTYEPFGDHLTEVKTKSIADALSISQRTVQRAILKLNELELIDLEIKSFGFRLRTQHATPMSLGDTHVASTTPMSPERHPCRLSDTRVASTTPMSRSQSETPTQSESCNSHTIQTYSDFIKTLSEAERENFLEFGRKKASQLPKPPELPLKWIEKNWEELRSQWEETEAGHKAKSSQIDWTQHPDWFEWLDFMRNRGVPNFVALGEWLDRKTRREIADWADERNLIWGAES